MTVTITPLDYGLAGGVTETLPNGFAYVSSDLSPSQVTELSGSNQVRFTLLGETSFDYTVTASASITAGSHTFSGTLRDFERDDYLVRGASSVTVEAPAVTTPPTPAHTTPPRRRSRGGGGGGVGGGAATAYGSTHADAGTYGSTHCGPAGRRRADGPGGAPGGAGR